jgi:2-methylcitrate dehydratase PrpD
MAPAGASVTERMAEWVVSVDAAEVPQVAVERVRNLVLDSIGNQFAGMTVPTGALLADWVRAQGAAPRCTVTAQSFKTTPTFATLVNGAASHALENDDVATFSSHPNSPLTAATLAMGEDLHVDGQTAVMAWAIGWEVTAQTMKVCLGPQGNELINRGWFNQGFQETLGVAALASRLLGLDLDQTRMALGNAASAMAGMMKNRGTDTKGFTAGSAAMHGVMAAELAAAGFTADKDILDGELGVARLLGLEAGDPEKMVDGLGTWDLATRGSTIRLYACCGAAHWSMAALEAILRDRPVASEEIKSIDVEVPSFLTPMMPNHDPATGLQAKYSLEYGLTAIALDGRAGVHQFTDDAVRRPEAQAVMSRVTTIAVDGPMESRVVLTLQGGEQLEASANRAHGNPADPLTQEEIVAKFDECATGTSTEAQRQKVVDLCGRFELLDDVGELAGAIGETRA